MYRHVYGSLANPLRLYPVVVVGERERLPIDGEDHSRVAVEGGAKLVAAALVGALPEEREDALIVHHHFAATGVDLYTPSPQRVVARDAAREVGRRWNIP